MNPLLEIHNLSIHFHTPAGSLHAIRGVSFQMYPGEIIGLVGESGCGKSVTAQAILQLLPKTQLSISGEILFQKENLLKKLEKEMQLIRGKEIGIIFQDPLSALNPTMRIGMQITEILRQHERLSKKEAQIKVLELLTQVGLTDAHHRFWQYPHELSGGMRQRVMIAMAIACYPRLIIADEPTTALDVTIQAQILELIQEIRQQRGISMLLITHDLGIVARLCDRVLVMYGGQIIESGKTNQIFASPQHPYTQALIQSKVSLMQAKDKELFFISGQPPYLLNPPECCLFTPRCPYAMNICQQAVPPTIHSGPYQHVACWLPYKKDFET